jgi:hypothetical protein
MEQQTRCAAGLPQDDACVPTPMDVDTQAEEQRAAQREDDACAPEPMDVDTKAEAEPDAQREDEVVRFKCRHVS